MSRYGIPRASVHSPRQEVGIPAHLPAPESAPRQKSLPWDEPDFPSRRVDPPWSRLTVFADISQSASEVIRHLEGFGASVHRKPIPADFAVGPLGIRRRPGELLAEAAREGALFREALVLARRFRHRLLVCEGEPGSPPTSRAAWGAIQEAALKAEVPVLLTRGPVETAQLILWVGRAVTSKPRPRRRHFSVRRGYLGLPEKRIRMLEDLPNVGYVLAQHLLERFGVVRGRQLRVSDACA